MHGTISLINKKEISSKLDKRITFYDSNGNKKKYKTIDIYAFSVENALYEGFWLKNSSSGFFSFDSRYEMDAKEGDRYFLKVVKKGPLSHYLLEWQEQGESLLRSMDLVKKDKDHYFIRATQGLFGLKRKVLIDYFAQCSALIELIRQKS